MRRRSFTLPARKFFAAGRARRTRARARAYRERNRTVPVRYTARYTGTVITKVLLIIRKRNHVIELEEGVSDVHMQISSKCSTIRIVSLFDVQEPRRTVPRQY